MRKSRHNKGPLCLDDRGILTVAELRPVPTREGCTPAYFEVVVANCPVARILPDSVERATAERARVIYHLRCNRGRKR